MIEQADRLQAIYFPTACPELNPQEHVWERARDVISHNHIVSLRDNLNETLFSTNFMDAFTPLGLGVS